MGSAGAPDEDDRCRPADRLAAVPASARASAPASSANLGPGFDVVALALQLRCTVTVMPAADWSLDSAGADGAALGLVRRAAALGAPEAGPFLVTVESAIPVGRGLGSSAALTVAVIAAARSAAGRAEDKGEILRQATAVEGHADNAAAAVYGGAVAVTPGGRVHRLEIHPSLRILVAVPDARLSTALAREALRAPVDTALAARTAARLLFLIEGLRRGDPALLAEAAGDELHEQRRAALSPQTSLLVEAARRAGAVHAAWSGAGPAALALVKDEASAVRAAWEGLLGPAGAILEPGIDGEGVRLEAAE